jgi:CBS domain-containing protein
MAGDDDLVDVARRLLEGHHDRLPVVAGRRLAGCVGRRELVRALHPDAEGPP